MKSFVKIIQQNKNQLRGISYSFLKNDERANTQNSKPAIFVRFANAFPSSSIFLVSFAFSPALLTEWLNEFSHLFFSFVCIVFVCNRRLRVHFFKWELDSFVRSSKLSMIAEKIYNRERRNEDGLVLRLLYYWRDLYG